MPILSRLSLCVATFVLLCLSSHGNESTLSRLPDAPGEISFIEVIGALAQSENITIVTEDEPLVSQLSAEQTVQLQTLINNSNNAAEKVAIVGTAFDYIAQPLKQTQPKNRVYVLKKKFTDVKDLPCVTLQEWLASLNDVSGILRRFSPELGPFVADDPRTIVFVKSLLPSQLDALQTRGGLPLTALSTEQKRYVSELGSHFYVQKPLAEFNKAKTAVSSAVREEAKIGWFNRFETRLFGVQSTMNIASRNYPYLYLVGSQSGFGNTVEGHLFQAKGFPLEPDTNINSAVNSQSRLDSKSPARGLNTIVASLSMLPGETRFAVSSALREKRAIVVGINNSSPVDVFRALGDAYGLRVRRKGANTYSLERYKPSYPLSLAGIQAAVESALPDPFLRAAKIAAVDGRRRQMATSRDEQSWRNAAEEVLSVAVQLQLKKENKDSLLVSELEPQQRTYFANILMARMVDRFDNYLQPDYVPRPIRDFESVTLTGGLVRTDEDKLGFSITLNTVDDKGRVLPWSGVTFLQITQFGFSP